MWYPAPRLGDLVGRLRTGFSNYDLKSCHLPTVSIVLGTGPCRTMYRVTTVIPTTAVLFPRWANGSTGLTSNCSRVLRKGRQNPASVFRLSSTTSFLEYKGLFLSLKQGNSVVLLSPHLSSLHIPVLRLCCPLFGDQVSLRKTTGIHGYIPESGGLRKRSCLTLCNQVFPQEKCGPLRVFLIP